MDRPRTAGLGILIPSILLQSLGWAGSTGPVDAQEGRRAGLANVAEGARLIPEPGWILYGVVRSATSVGDGSAQGRRTTGHLTGVLRAVDGSHEIRFESSLRNINDQYSYALVVPAETSIGVEVPPTPGTIRLGAAGTTYRVEAVQVDGQRVAVAGTAEFHTGSSGRGSLLRVDLVSDDVGESFEAWSTRIFGSVVDPDADEDGDGVSNLREYLAGTDPSDPRSVFEFISVGRTEVGIEVSWSSIAGRRYRLERSASPDAPPPAWIVVLDDVPATPPENRHTDTGVGNGNEQFYRVSVR